MKGSERPIDLASKINVWAGRPANHALKLYEEVRPTMIETIQSMETFQRLEIGTGDIICFCEDLSADELKELELPTPGTYFEHILNSVSVHFRDRNAPKDLTKQFTLLLSKKMTYDALAAKVAKNLETEPLMIRFVAHNLYTEGPKLEFKYEPEKLLEEMLQPNSYHPGEKLAFLIPFFSFLFFSLLFSHSFAPLWVLAVSEILYYEKLDISIKELESKKPVAVAWLTAKMTEEGPHKLLVNKVDNVEHLLEILKTKIKTPISAAPSPAPGTPKEVAKDGDVEMKDASEAPAAPAAAAVAPVDPEPHGTGELRLVEVFNNHVSRVFTNDEPVKSLNDYSTFYAEEIPSDQLQVAEGDQLVPCFHYHKDPYSSHGTPFLFLLKAVSSICPAFFEESTSSFFLSFFVLQAEPWEKTAQRLRKRMHVGEKEFEKYKFALVSFGKSKAITEGSRPLFLFSLNPLANF